MATIRNTVLTKCNSNVFRLTPKHYTARYPAAHGSVNCLIQGYVQIYCYTSISRQDATKSTVSNMNFSCHDLVHLSPEATTQRLLELASTVPHPVMILKPSTHCTCFSMPKHSLGSLPIDTHETYTLQAAQTLPVWCAFSHINGE